MSTREPVKGPITIKRSSQSVFGNALPGIALVVASVLPAVFSPSQPGSKIAVEPIIATTTGPGGAAITTTPAAGTLQIHFIDVGQGDGAILISPQGQTVMFDNGKRGKCDLPVSYLEQLGIAKIDYMVASHYHDDHIGCTPQVLTQFPLQVKAYDRGGSYNSATFTKYLNAIGPKRETVMPGQSITLDQGSANPVRIEFVAVNAGTADGEIVDTSNENDLSVVAVVRFGNFDAVIGGDLSGIKTDSYEDIETAVGPKIGAVEVYKVNHHGSMYSSNDNWLAALKPKVGIISTGVGNHYGHPTQECLDRLHSVGVKTYWTQTGAGAEPDPGLDIVGKNIVVGMVPGSSTFTVTYNFQQVDTYPLWDATPGTVPVATTFAWSKNSNFYHVTSCSYVQNINPVNLVKADTAPTGKTLHPGCPR